MLVRKILKWSDKKYDEAINEPKKGKGFRKALLSGAGEGFVDGCFIVGVTAIIASVISIIKGLKK